MELIWHRGHTCNKKIKMRSGHGDVKEQSVMGEH